MQSKIPRVPPPRPASWARKFPDKKAEEATQEKPPEQAEAAPAEHPATKAPPAHPDAKE